MRNSVKDVSERARATLDIALGRGGDPGLHYGW